LIDLIALGEMMLRLSPRRYERLRRASSLELRACGAQFNIAADLAALGRHSAFLTRLPDNELGHLAQSLAAGFGVDMSYAQFIEAGRMGLIFVEFGRSPRRNAHLYDREGSAASTITAGDFDWAVLVSGARFAYTDGIFPALNSGCQSAALAFLSAARQAGCTTCFDINYRESLWRDRDPLALYRQALPLVDVLVTNRTVSETVLGYSGSDEELLAAYQSDFGCRLVCLTYKEMQGLERGTWRSLARLNQQVVSGRNFDFEVVDPFGAGDAFFAGLIYGLGENGDLQTALDFGNALCALAHTVEGDQAIFSAGEVEALLAEGYSLVTRR
jgi:2-dehydro-3-deoxygluconokinase